MRFTLRAASAADVGGQLALWAEAAENAARSPDTAEAVTALLSRDPASNTSTRPLIRHVADSKKVTSYRI